MPPPSPDVPTAYRLLVHFPNGSRRLPLPPGESIVGSEAGCRIVLQHLTVSRRHARFLLDGSGLRLEDLGSSNGTRMGGERLRGVAEVGHGAELEFGGVRAVVERVAEGDLAALGPAGSPPLAPPLSPQSVAPPPPSGGAASGVPTFGGAAMEEFLLRRLPGLLEGALAGAGALELAQAFGAEIFRTFPCRGLAILTEEGGTVLFFAGDEGATPDLDLSHLGFRCRAAFATPGLARLLEPLARLGLSLVASASRSGSPGRRAPGAGRSTPGDPLGRPAGPLSLHHHTVDKALQALLARVERVARGDIGVLIRGESGTGKEVLARSVHDLSPFARAPFVPINCASLPHDLLEAELFGIERAVATGVEARPGKFESAHGGTLFLDEIGDMALETQAKILRVLQEGEVYRLGAQHPRPARPRLVAATNRDLDAMLEAGTFRRDLYYRLAGFVVRLPPLRERSVDIPNLAVRFLAEAGERHGLQPGGLSVRAAELLARYDWPGNIRELKHEIERAALFLQDGELLDSTALDERFRRGASATGEPETLKDRLEAFERNEIERALRQAGGDVPRAAQGLGVGRSTLYRRMQVLGLAGGEGGEEEAGG